MQGGGRIEIKGYLPVYTSLTFKRLDEIGKCKLKLKLMNMDDVEDELEINKLLRLFEKSIKEDEKNSKKVNNHPILTFLLWLLSILAILLSILLMIVNEKKYVFSNNQTPPRLSDFFLK